MRSALVQLAAGLALVAPSLAELSMASIADQCADASGYNSCYQQALSSAQTCYQQNCEGEGTCTSENDCTSSNPDCVSDCSCIAYSDMIQCAVTHCWNQVFTCEYQHLAISTARNCPVSLGDTFPDYYNNTGWVWIPYFPSDPSRPASCSCDIGYVYLNQRERLTEHTTCYNNAADRTAALYACDCCASSAEVSVFYNTCPSTDPAAVIADGDMPQFPYGSFAASATCASVFADGVDCEQLGYANTNASTDAAPFYAPDNIPSNGTETLTRNAGTVTSPPFPTITWALGKGLSSTVAVAVTTGSPSSSGGGGGGGSGSGGTGTAAATSPGATHNSAAYIHGRRSLRLLLPLIVVTIGVLF